MDRKILVLGVCALLSLISPALLAQSLRVTFLDVGEGEAILLESAGQTALVDTGNPTTGHRVVDYLLQRDIHTLDMLIITHPHLDHLGGFFQLQPHIRVDKRYDNGEVLPIKQNIYRWYSDTFRRGDYRALERGDVITLGEAQLTVLNSAAADRNWNDNSLVMMLEHDQVRILLTGDASSRVEQALLDNDVPVTAHLLKLGHHGSAKATSDAWLSRVNPDFAVISIDAGNIRGYPSAEVVARVRDRGIKLFETSKDGTVVFESDGVKVNLP